MNGGVRAHEQKRQQHKQHQNQNSKRAIATIRDRFAERFAIEEQFHTASDLVRVHERYRITMKTVASCNINASR